MPSRRYAKAWVLGGHRGRLYADNAAALHRLLLREPEGPRVFWITCNPRMFREFRSQGRGVLWKHSFEARRALLKAKVLVYSHGEDDLDDHLLRWTRLPGIRIFLNHSMNHIKGGQMFRNDVRALPAKKRRRYERSLVDFDWFLCSSPREKANLELCFPHRKDRILVGGGAHLDEIWEGRNARVEPVLLWFPTFRDPGMKGPPVEDVVARVVGNARLLEYLERTGRVLEVCRHINTPRQGTEPGDPTGPVRFLEPGSAVSRMLVCEAFISDYSGLICDYLALGRPIIHFPFDMDAFLEIRSFFVPYGDLAFGPIARSVEELVDCIVSERWRDTLAHRQRREYWLSEYFPHREPVYAKATLDAIRGLLGNSQP